MVRVIGSRMKRSSIVISLADNRSKLSSLNNIRYEPNKGKRKKKIKRVKNLHELDLPENKGKNSLFRSSRSIACSLTSSPSSFSLFSLSLSVSFSLRLSLSLSCSYFVFPLLPLLLLAFPSSFLILSRSLKFARVHFIDVCSTF